jgi:cyclophilin family peptidyl-prolyl cis-trans isomerase/HEAT repeat protein
MKLCNLRKTVCAGLLLVLAFGTIAAQRRSSASSSNSFPANILVRILRAEDQRRWDDNLKSLLSDKDARVRKRAALAAGRIGDEQALPALADLLKSDSDNEVRQMAAFAIGEIDSYAGADSLYRVLGDTSVPRPISARAVEALGKISAALPESDKEHKQEIGKAILGVLGFESDPRVTTDRLTALLGLTAALRARPEGAGPVVVKFLKSRDPRIVADALNTMARLRLKDNNEEVRGLLKHGDPIVRANAARVIGAAEDKGAFEALLDRALHDQDLRVRVSAIRALGALKDERAALPLSQRGAELFHVAHLQNGNGAARNEGLEIRTALGQILAGKPSPNSGPEAATRGQLSLRVRAMSNENILEDEVALAREDSNQYLDYLKGFESAAALPSSTGLSRAFYTWRSITARAAGLGELARVKPPVSAEISEGAQLKLRQMLNDPRTPVLAVPNVLTAYALFKPTNLNELLNNYLRHTDVIVRATAAELLGNQPPSEANTRALIEALPRALRDKDLNDAALAILDALGKQKSAAANEAIKTGLDSSDHLIRRRAVALLKANGAGDFSNRIGYVQTRNTDADYRRAIGRIGKKVSATVVTSKGSFTIEFLPEDAPLTVDNFVILARKGYFNGQTVPRVVPNFVVQTGDPRGDQNGGPGYSIRCEINEAPYDRAAVGMALSGKDTGGSQWFVTHSPQPHLDGGYTVFGRVVAGMDVVDRIARGDTIRRVIVNER